MGHLSHQNYKRDHNEMSYLNSTQQNKILKARLLKLLELEKDFKERSKI